MPIALVTALISAGGLVLGSVIGAICSWFISKFSLHEQKRLQKENLNYQQQCKCMLMLILLDWIFVMQYIRV